MSERRAGRVAPAPEDLLEAGPATPSRRRFLRSAAGVSAGLIATSSVAQTTSSSPPDVPAWSRTLGAPILASPYGVPSRHEESVRRRESPVVDVD